MLRLFILVASLLITTNAHAVRVVCYDATTLNTQSRHQGDCYTNGLCSGYNDTGLKSNCIFATKEEYDKAANRFTEYDANIVSGSRIVDMQQSEIDSIVAAETAAAQAALTTSVRSSADGGVDDFDGTFVLIRALALVTLDEINVLRSQHGLAPRTLGQLKSSMKTKISNGDAD